MGGFLAGIFGGSDPNLNKNIHAFNQDAGFATNVGNADVTAASKFYTDILSGDPTKEAEAIAPETKAAQDQAQQEKDTLAQFAPRSGGTAATTAGIDEGTRSKILALLGQLKGGSASGAASLGTTEQGMSLADKQASDAASQQRLENWRNSILGESISSGLGTLESFGLGKIPGMGGGGGGGMGDAEAGGFAEGFGGVF